MKKLIALVSTFLLSTVFAGELSDRAQIIDQLSINVKKLSESIEYGNAGPRAQRRLKIQLQELIEEAELMKRSIGGGHVGGPTRPPHNISCAQSDSRTMQASFKIIKQMAYSGEGLNKTSSAATSFANEWVNKYPCHYASQYIQALKDLKSFAYSGNGLNKTTSAAASFALLNVDNVCLNYPLRSEFKRNYDFAYSGSGLNRTASAARAYAYEQVKHLAFSCQNI